MNRSRRDVVFAGVSLYVAGPRAHAARPLKVGMLLPTIPPTDTRNAASLIPAALEHLGYVPSAGFVLERRFAEGRPERLDTLAGELVRARVDVIVTVALPATRAAVKATTTIPIVFYGNFDPLAAGVVNQLARPGRNVTGVLISPDGTLAAKRLELLSEMLPGIKRIGFLATEDRVSMGLQSGEARKAAGRLGLEMPMVIVHGSEYGAAFAALVAQRVGAVLVAGSTFFLRDRKGIIDLAARHRLACSYEWREHVEDGGLMSYGTSLTGTTARVAAFVDRIAKGGKPAEMAVEQPSEFELAINARTARELGIKLPAALALRVDRMIE